MNKISYIWKIKATETLGHAYSSSAYACFLHAYEYIGILVHTRVLETMKDNCFALKIWFWNESHIILELFQTPINLL